MIALDLFAGTGWGVACHRLGIEEYGVEVMPEARAIRKANGMRTIYSDVWSGLIDRSVLETQIPGYDLLIASPPCQTFSMAGSGKGRQALDEVLRAIDERRYLDPEALRAFGEEHDPKTALVLTPLAHVARDAPMYVVLEQVPPALPVWECYAEEMRRWGYSVWTGNLQAEMYGVPQTRKRAILIARADGREAKAPTPTHSRYYSRDPQRLDPGVKPWVSMAEALGWGSAQANYLVGNQVPPGSARDEYHNRRTDSPAQSVTGSAGSMQWSEDGRRTTGRHRGGFEFVNGNRERAARRRDSEPAPTIHFGAAANDVRLVSPQSVAGEGRAERDGDEPSVTVTSNFSRARLESDRPAPTVTGGGAATGGAEVFGRHGRAIIEKMHLDPAMPATTVAGDPRLSSRDHHEPGAQNARSTRVSVEEAAALQSYPADFIWDAEFSDPKTGRAKPVTKTNKFLQVGNAVPPLLAEAILREALSNE